MRHVSDDERRITTSGILYSARAVTGLAVAAAVFLDRHTGAKMLPVEQHPPAALAALHISRFRAGDARHIPTAALLPRWA